MKKIVISPLLIGLLLSCLNLFPAFDLPQTSISTSMALPSQGLDLDSETDLDPDLEVKQKALAVLQEKCNVCHKKKNPFKVFSLKNMDKHAPKIYKQVFVYQRMPKGNKIKLTEEESQTLRNWLKSKNIF